jgi:hypothetical protein
MDLAACDASGRGLGTGSEHTASRGRWPRDFAHGCLLYLVPTIIFFVVYAIGLWRLPSDFSGMYGNDDGIWAAWNLRGIFEWSRPFDLAPFNPLSGMGSTFLPNTPWLNPAALALALPLPRDITYLISYFVYFVELSLSLILLFRVVGLAPLEAIICAQLYLLILFPPTNGNLVTLMWYSLAPVNAHLVAICNVLLVLILIIGRYGFWTNVICGAGVFFLLVCGLFSAPVTFLTYAPVYAVAGVALLLGAKPNAEELGWKVAAILASGAVLWLLGFKDYLQGTSLISGRTSLYPAAFAAGADLLTWSYWRDAWVKFDTCAHPFFLCPRFPNSYIVIASSLGALLYAFQRSTIRAARKSAMLLFFALWRSSNLRIAFVSSRSAHAIGSPFFDLELISFHRAISRPPDMPHCRNRQHAIPGAVAAIAVQPIIESWRSDTCRGGNDPRSFPALAFADWELRSAFFFSPRLRLTIPRSGCSAIEHPPCRFGAITPLSHRPREHRAGLAVSRIYRHLPGGPARTGDAAAADRRERAAIEQAGNVHRGTSVLRSPSIRTAARDRSVGAQHPDP